MVWDRGFWTPEGSTDVDASLRKGELKFTLAGEKLRGSWVLMRIKPRRAVLVCDCSRQGNARPADKIGLVSFCKTTGGKALHVVNPRHETC